MLLSRNTSAADAPPQDCAFPSLSRGFRVAVFRRLSGCKGTISTTLPAVVPESARQGFSLGGNYVKRRSAIEAHGHWNRPRRPRGRLDLHTLRDGWRVCKPQTPPTTTRYVQNRELIMITAMSPTRRQSCRLERQRCYGLSQRCFDRPISSRPTWRAVIETSTESLLSRR